MISVRYKVMAVPYYWSASKNTWLAMLLKDTKSGDWCFAGGGVKNRESLLDAVQRELFEETHGYTGVVSRLHQLITESPSDVKVHVSSNTNRGHYANKENEGNIIELWFTLVFPISEEDAICTVKHMADTAQCMAPKMSQMMETSCATFVDVEDFVKEEGNIYQSIWDVQRCLCKPVTTMIQGTQGSASCMTLETIPSLEKNPLAFREWYHDLVMYAYHCKCKEEAAKCFFNLPKARHENNGCSSTQEPTWTSYTNSLARKSLRMQASKNRDIGPHRVPTSVLCVSNRKHCPDIHRSQRRMQPTW